VKTSAPKRFWKGVLNFKFLLDEAALLPVRLRLTSPIRAAIADNPRDHDTRAKIESTDLGEREDPPAQQRRLERSRRRAQERLDEPIEIDEQHDAVAPCLETPVDGASSKGFLAVSLARSSGVADWTGPPNCKHSNKGADPEHLAPDLSRIGIDPPGGW